MTTIEHIKTTTLLTTNLRELLLERYDINFSYEECDKLSETIRTCFNWRLSPEGYNFWAEIYNITKEHERNNDLHNSRLNTVPPF